MEKIRKMCNKSFRIYIKHDVPPVAELISTEESYVAKLEAVVVGYIKEFCNKNSDIKIPESLKQHDIFLIFGNILEIYDWHKNYLLVNMKKHQNSLKDLAKLFIENEQEFHMYSKYISNKYISDHLIRSHEDYFLQVKNKLNYSITIVDLMIEPVQRLPRYGLLLGEILRHLKKKGMDGDNHGLQKVHQMMKKVSAEANKFETINCIRNFDGLIWEQGKLLHSGTLKCIYNKKHYNFYVFVFKRKIIFTEDKSKGNEREKIYDFRLQIPMNKLCLKELTHNQFFLKLQDPNIDDCYVKCEASSKEDYKQWLDIIKQQLDLQLTLIHALVHPKTDDDNKKEMLL